MTANKTYFWQTSLVLTLVWVLGNSPQMLANLPIFVTQESTPPLPSRSAPDEKQSGGSNFRPLNYFQVPPKGAPGKRQDEGSDRGLCPTVDVGVTALVPPTNIGLTISEHPTFWFYIPYSDRQEKATDFVLLDENKNIVYQTSLQFDATPGTVGITLPANSPALEVGKKYQWTFSYICNPNNAAEDALVRGYVERVAPSLEVTQELQAATTPEKRLAIYGQNGFWHDAITLLGELLLGAPDKFQRDWQSLLEAIGLEEIANSPIVEPKRPE